MDCNRTCCVCVTCHKSGSPSLCCTSPAEVDAENRTVHLCNLQQSRKRAGKIWPTGKCWMFFENTEKCFKTIHPCWRLFVLFWLHLSHSECWSACVPVSGKRMNYQRNWVFFSSWVYGLGSVISFQLCLVQNSSQHDFRWKLENKAGFFL